MAFVNMDSIHFYQPPFMNPLFSGKRTASLHIDAKSQVAALRKKGSDILESAGITARGGGGDFGLEDGLGQDGKVTDEDYLPTIEELLHPISRKENSTEELANTEHISQQLFGNSNSSINIMYSRLADGLGSQERPVVIEEDESDSDDIESGSDDLAVNEGSVEASLPIPPMTISSLTNDSWDNDGLQDNDIEKRLYIALNRQHSQPLQDQFYQQHPDNDDQRCHDISEKLTRPVPNTSEQDNEGQKPQQFEDKEVEVEQERQDSTSVNNYKIDVGDSAIDNSKSNSDQVIDQDSSKRRRQHSTKRLPTIPTRQQQYGEVADEGAQKDDEQESHYSGRNSDNESDDDYNDGHVNDNNEDPRPTKRRRPSCYNYPTSKRSRKYYRQNAPVQTQREQSPSILPSDHLHSKVACNPTPAGDEQSTSNVSAEYQEWPMRGVFKRVIVGDEVRYGMEFSQEDLQVGTCPQHTVAHQSSDSGDLQPSDSWDIRRITGMRKVDGIEEFRVAWAQTWMPKSDLGRATELVEEFRARLSVRHSGRDGQGKTSIAGETQLKRRRGRPRKRS